MNRGLIKPKLADINDVEINMNRILQEEEDAKQEIFFEENKKKEEKLRLEERKETLKLQLKVTLIFVVLPALIIFLMCYYMWDGLCTVKEEAFSLWLAGIMMIVFYGFWLIINSLLICFGKGKWPDDEKKKRCCLQYAICYGLSLFILNIFSTVVVNQNNSICCKQNSQECRNWYYTVMVMAVWAGWIHLCLSICTECGLCYYKYCKGLVKCCACIFCLFWKHW